MEIGRQDAEVVDFKREVGPTKKQGNGLNVHCASQYSTKIPDQFPSPRVEIEERT